MESVSLSVASRGETDPQAFVPRAWTVLASGVLASPFLAFIQASQLLLQRRLERSGSTLLWEWTHLLPQWLVLAICAAAIVPLVRKFPLPQANPARAVVAHVVAALLFPVFRLGLLDAIH